MIVSHEGSIKDKYNNLNHGLEEMGPNRSDLSLMLLCPMVYKEMSYPWLTEIKYIKKD